MGGLWVDYNLMTTIPGLFALGEANFSDHGANRLGASALMQGLADGYFVIPYTLGGYLATAPLPDIDTGHAAFADAERQAAEQIGRLTALNGGTPVEDFHRRLGRILWEKAGMARSAEGLVEARGEIAELRDRFWAEASVPGSAADLNTVLERAGRVADFLEFGDLIVQDALHREESCGSHFRVEHQTPDNEALRDDERFSYVAAWEHQGVGTEARLHREDLTFDVAHPTARSYK
jgi:succinate dehydrogenase / fumarate reductase flavoprotein subunit